MNSVRISEIRIDKSINIIIALYGMFYYFFYFKSKL